jgi:hypothetical protein
MSTGGLLDELTLCPRCGELVEVLSDKTGWCFDCTRSESIFKCERCGTEFKSKTHRPFCTYCRELNWLEAHADEIEEFMVQGCSFKFARGRVSEAHRPRCVACGSPLPKVGYFCKTKPSCRKLYSRFHKKRQKGISVQQALEQVMDEAHEHFIVDG